MADFKLRLPDDLATRFDAWAGPQGGRSPALRRVIAHACSTPSATAERLPPRPLKLTVRLTAEDGCGLDAEARALGLTANGWAAALIRHRLHGRPTFPSPAATALIAIQAEYRRIGVNVNQITRALNTAVMAGQVLDLELAYLEDLRTELRVHMSTLRAAFNGVQAYWAGEP